jgi:phospholipase/lecithinase/hemolysin
MLISNLHATLAAKACSLPNKKKVAITGINIIGDSLSDKGRKYKEKLLGCIPYSLFFHKSSTKQFTNGFVWTYPLIERMRFAIKEMAVCNPLYNFHNHAIMDDKKSFGKNVAEGGSTAYNYGGFFNIFRYFKGLFLSFFLNNIQTQTRDLKQHGGGIQPNDLNLIFAGANDFVTVGYCNPGGAKRAVQGIQKCIEMLTTNQDDDTAHLNYSKNIVLFTLPDFSKTPRFAKKSARERTQAKETCQLFNEELKKLAGRYQYIDFTFCDIYQALTKEDINLDKIKEKGIIITGKGDTKKIYFVVQGKLLVKDSAEELVVAVRLSKAQQKMLDGKPGKVVRTEDNRLLFDDLIYSLAGLAKLNADVKVFDAAAVFDAIEGSPEAYGFTSGCAIYYCFDEQIPGQIKGNALVLKRMDINKLEISFFQNGEQVKMSNEKVKTIELILSPDALEQLTEKLKSYSTGLVQLASAEDKHDLWSTRIIQAAVKAYKDLFKEEIRLADIYVSILLAVKKHLPNQERIFWDDLHPTVTVHFLLELVFARFFMNNYTIKNPRQWLDDTALQQEADTKTALPAKSYEAPAQMRYQR